MATGPLSRSPRPSPGAPGTRSPRRELLGRRRAEQPAERAGQQERARARVDALAGHVDERRSQDLARRCRVGDEEVAGERRATGRAQHHVGRTIRGSSGSSPCARSRSRRSTSIDSPRRPCTPSRARDRATAARRWPSPPTTSRLPWRTADSRRADEPRQLAGHHEQQEHEAARGQHETADEDRPRRRTPAAPTREVAVVPTAMSRATATSTSSAKPSVRRKPRRRRVQVRRRRTARTGSGGGATGGHRGDPTGGERPPVTGSGVRGCSVHPPAQTRSTIRRTSGRQATVRGPGSGPDRSPLRLSPRPTGRRSSGSTSSPSATPSTTRYGAGDGTFEPDRTHLALLDDMPVGLTSAYTLSMSVPGGPASRPMAGVTWVGVLPTHRRRGVLSALMRASSSTSTPWRADRWAPRVGAGDLRPVRLRPGGATDVHDRAPRRDRADGSGPARVARARRGGQ